MFKNRCLKIITTSFLLFLVISCDDDDNVTNPPIDQFEGTTLLGMVNGRTLTYIQTDTIISAEPYSITTETSNQVIKLSGQGSDWIVSKNNQAIINLKITSSSVIQNGYWREVNASDSLFYFAAPPQIMKRGLKVSDSWIYYTPKFENDTSSIYMFFYYAYFGFSSTKEYVGIEEVITPGGAFNAYRFDVQLFANVFDLEPSALVTEYYYPNVGLVQLKLNAGPLKRSMNLISYIDTSR